jgi:hypothetical protein
MPYIRTLNAMSIMNEISLFIGVSLLLTFDILFFFPFLQSYINRYYNCNYRGDGPLASWIIHQITVLTAVVPT